MMRAAAWMLALTLMAAAAYAHAGEEEVNEATQKAIAKELDELARDAKAGKAPAVGESKAKTKIREILKGPDFSPEETYSIPSWKGSDDDEPSRTPGWIRYLEKFFRALAEFMRAGVWVLAGVGVLLILILLHYWWRTFAARPRPLAPEAPAHVAGLDIRAESLPEDVSAAARELLRRGEVIGALSLLYRGALSALVLRFDARIRASFTEQECARAARKVLPLPGADYFQGLTRTWIHAVYARRIPDSETALSLCDAFETYFAPRKMDPIPGATAGAAASAAVSVKP